VRFDTLGPAMEAGLKPTVVVDRPVIQQIFLKHGLLSGTVRINSRITSYEDLGSGAGVKVRLLTLETTIVCKKARVALLGRLSDKSKTWFPS